jgi:hypothetical protein
MEFRILYYLHPQTPHFSSKHLNASTLQACIISTQPHSNKDFLLAKDKTYIKLLDQLSSMKPLNQNVKQANMLIQDLTAFFFILF